MNEKLKKLGKTMQLLFWLDRRVFVLICVIRSKFEHQMLSLGRISKLIPPLCYKEGFFVVLPYLKTLSSLTDSL